jgi:hypothetical protein
MRRTRGVPRDLRTVASHALDAGWVLEYTGSGHVAWRSPDGPVVHTASTPGDRRTRLNVTAQLRRAGLKMPGRRKARGER